MMDVPDLLAALHTDRLEVHYQPVVLLPHRNVLGFEALARLRRPDGVLVPPEAFVPVAERSGLIVPLGAAVLRRAVEDAARWSAADGPITTATVGVNVAPAQLGQPGFADFVLQVLADHGVPGSTLILEITESTVTSPRIRPVLERLAEAGVRAALDDFGVGFATLDNLRRIPVHILKLDASFIAGVTREGADRAIVRVVIDLADKLGLSVVAEGVETEEQAQSLARLGCPAAQGNLFAAAHRDPADAVDAVLRIDPARSDLDDGPPLWPAEVDSAVLGAVRLLAVGADRHRAVVHAVAGELARVLALPLNSARLIGRLALVHDLRRLAVDGALPGLLHREPLLAALLRPAAAGSDVAGVDGELAAVRLAVAIADDACRLGPDLSAGALQAALRERARTGRSEDVPLAGALDVLADEPPVIVPLEELLDHLDRCRLGRRGTQERVRALVGITRVLASSGDPVELLTAGLEEVRRIVGAASASLERWEREYGHLRTLLNVGRLGPGEERAPSTETYKLSEYAQARRTLLTGLPYIHTVDDADADVEAVELLRSLQKYSSAAVPLHLEGRVWGQLWLTTEVGDPPFRAADVEMLTAVATLMSVVVAQAESLDRMARLAFEDALTRVGNRRAVDDALARLAAAGRDTTLLLIDVDLLKEINDTLGHANGDLALVRVADALSHELVRLPGASVGRLGGDEFCVVAPQCPQHRAREWIRVVQSLLTESYGGPGISVGIATASAPWQPRDLLAAADADLYAAKRLRPLSPTYPR